VDSMFRGSRAPWGRSEDRCDGAVHASARSKVLECITRHAPSSFTHCVRVNLAVIYFPTHWHFMSFKHPHKPPLTIEEYEDVYREAVLCLREIADVGEPFRRPDGIRVCDVDGTLLDDGEVLERWWGKPIADSIKRQRAKAQSGPL
jgi:hypothetical protein